MADDYLTDEQQAEHVRHWLRQNGAWIIGGVLLGLAALFGWQQWQSRALERAEQASARYEALASAARSQGLEGAVALLGELASEHAGSPYVDQGRLLVARLHVDRNEIDQAMDYLDQVARAGSTAEIRHIATLRLARLLIYRERHEEALSRLRDGLPGAFAALASEVRGDAYAALGRVDEARSEYDKVLAAADAGAVIDRNFVLAKRDDLGAPASAVPATGE